MKYTILPLLFISFLSAANPTEPGVTGEQNGDLNTNTQNSTVNSNNETISNSKTYNGAGSSGMPVYSAVAPSLMSSGNDSCLKSSVGGLQLAFIGASAGKYTQDLECNRRKDSKTLRELGMSVAAISLMCQNDGVWEAMFTSGTPCPISINGRLVAGRAAFMLMKSEPDTFVRNYATNKELYNRILAIGSSESNNEENTDTRSLSERFRTSLRTTVE